MTPSIETIQRLCAREFGVSVMDILSRRRPAPAVRARHTAMYLARHLTRCSFPEIGRMFGDRDHTTVMHGVASIERRILADVKFGGRVETLSRCLDLPDGRAA